MGDIVFDSPLCIGHYVIRFIPVDPEPKHGDMHPPKQVTLYDTRTGESGVFDADAVGHCITECLDFFMKEQF